MTARLEWTGDAYKKLSALTSTDPAAVQRVVALAVAVGRSPNLAEREATSVANYFSVRGGGWFVVYTEPREDSVRIVGFGPVA